MKQQQVPKVVGKQINTSQTRNRKVSPNKNPSQNIRQVHNASRPSGTSNRPQIESAKKSNPNSQPKSAHLSNQTESSLNSHQPKQDANQIPAISHEYDKMRLRLQELKELLAQLEAKWAGTISEKQNQHQSLVSQLNKQHEMKIKQLEQSFTSQTSSSRNATMEKQINEMKTKAENLEQEGKSSEAQQILRQARELEMQLKGGESYFKMRELEARKQPMIKAHQVKMAQIKEQHESEIRKLEQSKKAEIDPIQIEIDKLEKRIHGDAAKAARSPLCRKD